MWRPQLRDPADELVLEAAVNGRAEALVTFNRRDFGAVPVRFGIDMPAPAEAMENQDMKDRSTFPLRLPRSVKAEVVRRAKQDGTSVNQFVATAVAKKLAAMNTAEFFAERRAQADLMLSTGSCDARAARHPSPMIRSRQHRRLVIHDAPCSPPSKLCPPADLRA
ncbi:MAG: PIN domain-containing protein [Stellaceae bacterium]